MRKKKTKTVINPDLKRRALTQEVNLAQTRLKNAISRGYDSKTIDLLRKHYNSAKKELEAFLDEADNNVR